MPISKALLLGVACSILSACAIQGVSRAAPQRIQLPDGMIVAGAEGWCVDPALSRARQDRAVVVLGSCAAISGTDQTAPDIGGVVTVSVDADGAPSPSLDALEGFFDSAAGRAALARDGQAESVDILDMRRDDDMLFLHAADASAAPGIAPDIWRALFDLEGRLVSVSLFGVVDQPIASELGRTALFEQVESLRAVNANTEL